MIAPEPAAGAGSPGIRDSYPNLLALTQRLWQTAFDKAALMRKRNIRSCHGTVRLKRTRDRIHTLYRQLRNQVQLKSIHPLRNNLRRYANRSRECLGLRIGLQVQAVDFDVVLGAEIFRGESAGRNKNGE